MTENRRRVVITGMGGLCPIGNSSREMWENARKGTVGIGQITHYDTSDMEIKLAGEVKDFDPAALMSRQEARRLSRFTQFAIAAADEAFRQSGLDMKKEDPLRCGINLSSGIGGLDVIEREHSKALNKGFDRVSPLFIPMSITNMAAGMTAIRLGFKGSCTCLVTACASSTNAIGEAFHYIRDGYADVMAAGGTESCITPLAVAGFHSMRALSKSEDPLRASIPFDQERSGFVMGEGAGILMLEEYEHAKRRGAEILGEICGYGASCDAHHMTAPLEDGSGAASCMETALQDAGIQPSEVGYINAHGTGTPLNDKGETRAVHTAFGETAGQLIMSSTKSMTGHLLGASGAVEAIFTVSALRDQIAPPTAGYRVPDPECDIPCAPNAAQPIHTAYAMSNSLGFGGHNASLVFRAAGR